MGSDTECTSKPQTGFDYADVSLAASDRNRTETRIESDVSQFLEPLHRRHIERSESVVVHAFERTFTPVPLRTSDHVADLEPVVVLTHPPPYTPTTAPANVVRRPNTTEESTSNRTKILGKLTYPCVALKIPLVSMFSSSTEGEVKSVS